jgi:murein DD-endopeptidase MepM/ murein hydrolase activator NlpD
MRVHPVTGAYKLHTGVDFEGTDGVYHAAAAGVVTYAGYDGAYGYLVKIDHGVVGGHHVETWYAHQPGLVVAVGQAVGQGEVVGEIGSSGYSTGPHAHFELLVDGAPVDPLPYLR